MNFRILILVALFFLPSITLAQTVPLNETDFDKTFLLSVTAQTGPRTDFLRTRDVKFVLTGSTVSLVEQTQGGAGVLYQFPIVSQDTKKKTVWVNLESGVDKVFQEPSLFNPVDAAENPKSYALRVVPLPSQTSKKVRRASDKISIDFAVDLPLPSDTLTGKSECESLSDEFCVVTQGMTQELKLRHINVFMRLVPKKILPGFKPKLDSVRLQTLGIYATHPDSLGRSFLAKHDLTKTLVYYSNLPKDLERAAIEAAYYWNQILTRKFIRIKPRPQGLDEYEPYVHTLNFIDQQVGEGHGL